MDAEKFKKRQSLKVIISEAIMVLAVIGMVVVLALVVSGYWLNSDLKVERQGMVQVSSIPTGADLDIDGSSSWLQRTNTSKVLSSGEHTVTVSKDGYDSWSKTINISEGYLYRLHYPRLFLQDREIEKVLDTTGSMFASISPDYDKLLLADDTTEWQIIDLNADILEPKKLNLSDFLSGASLAEDASVGLFTGEILSADWDRSGDHVLFKLKIGDKVEWVLVDVNNAKNSINLTKEFGTDFDKIEILDNSSSNLLVVQDGNLRKIDVSGKAISAVLASSVYDFDHYENEIVFSAVNEQGKYTVGWFKIGSNEIKEFETVDQPIRVLISKFYDEMYITTLQDKYIAVYKKVDFEPVSNYDLTFVPATIEIGHDGEFVTMNDGTKIATLDMEARAVREWSVEGNNFDWIDNDMIYTVANGELIVYDFDGYNRRSIAKNVSNHFPVAITDNKWLYYFSDGELTREKLTR